MDKKCNDDQLFVKPIEFCSLNALKFLSSNYPNDESYNVDPNTIFNKNLSTTLTDLNYKFRDDQKKNNYIFKYEGTDDRNKNLCGQTNKIDEYYVNCVLQTSNPLFTYKDEYCLVSPEIILPPELKKIEDKNNNIIIKLDRSNLHDEEGNFKFQKVQNNKYCEDRWYDWIVIPNYHLGNRILKDSGVYSKEDVKVCYNNCGDNELPYINSSGKKLCISKEIAYEGIYEKKLDYSPLALINLIGNNKYHLNLLFKNMYVYKLNNKLITDKYAINPHVGFSESLNDDNNYIINEVFNEIKKVLNKIVNDNNVNIPDYSIEYKILTYKHPYFKENDLITILGMDKNEILSNDIILIHTAYLAYNYYNFTDKCINDKEYFKVSSSININKHDNFFNINKILDDFDIKTNEKKQRLANILYKAINICYDKKTDFSKNLINRTLEAFKRYDTTNKEDLIVKFNFINKQNITYYNDIKTYLEIITNGFEISYYKYDFLKKFYENFNNFITGINEDDKISIKNKYVNDFKFYREEDSEIINGNKCKSGEILIDDKCKKCDDECNTIDKYFRNPYCLIYCKTNFETINNENTKCGGTTKDYEKPIKELQQDIKTPIEEETIFPDFSYIFKSAIKIFFILIVLYIAYMFYKIFNESILTFGNIFYGFIDMFYYGVILRNPIKTAEYYENIIQDKYNKVIRKTMT